MNNCINFTWVLFFSCDVYVTHPLNKDLHDGYTEIVNFYSFFLVKLLNMKIIDKFYIRKNKFEDLGNLPWNKTPGSVIPPPPSSYKNNYGGGYNAARGLISRDIANLYCKT